MKDNVDFEAIDAARLAFHELCKEADAPHFAMHLTKQNGKTGIGVSAGLSRDPLQIIGAALMLHEPSRLLSLDEEQTRDVIQALEMLEVITMGLKLKQSIER